jgi:hypothetical protein
MRRRVLVLGNSHDGQHGGVLPYPGIQVSLASYVVERRTACQVGRDSRPGAQDRHDCVTTVFTIVRWGAPAVTCPA